MVRVTRCHMVLLDIFKYMLITIHEKQLKRIEELKGRILRKKPLELWRRDLC